MAALPDESPHPQDAAAIERARATLRTTAERLAAGGARDEALALMDGVTADELADIRADVAERGYRAEWRGVAIREKCARLVEIASAALVRMGEKDTDGSDESRYLRTLAESAQKGETFAERLLRLYEKKWDRDLERLWDEVEFFHEQETSELVHARTRP